MVHKVNRFIKNWDFFGYKIELNYNRAGSTFKTTAGGIASLLITAFVYFVFAMRIYQILNQSNPTISSEFSLQSLANINMIR